MCKFLSPRPFSPLASFGCSAVLALIATIQLRADVILPTGLAPGSQYEVAFVTSDGTTATSNNIADYNNFVTAEANQDSALAGLGVSWNAIGSTPTVNADVNAPSGGAIPVYNTAGQLVADASHRLYSLPDHYNPIAYDQFGDLGPTTAWTGSVIPSSDLDTPFPIPLGSPLEFGGFSADWGNTRSTSRSWMYAGVSDQSSILSLYALSSPINVVPEPATLTLLGTAVLGLLYLRRRQSRP